MNKSLVVALSALFVGAVGVASAAEVISLTARGTVSTGGWIIEGTE